MSNRILILPSYIANQIAAGEVIERPASVIKELLENSLDASANNVTIDINHAGFDYIKVSDNGNGILAADLTLAIAPFATSKITHLNDLYSLNTMGFRGEALASIAAISKLTILSKPKCQEHAISLHMKNGVTYLEPCARNLGTTIEVQELFFNTPVRKKFLKSESIEFSHIEKYVKAFALCHSHIGLKLIHNSKSILILNRAISEEEKLARIRKILGKSFSENTFHISAKYIDLEFYGWFSTKNYQRSQTDQQYIYINNRIVKDKLLSHAIKKAYDGILYPGRHPAYLLNLKINPHNIDVNVHPTKNEVRFLEPRLVHDFLTLHLEQTLHLPPTKTLATNLTLDLSSTQYHKNIATYTEEKLQNILTLNENFGLFFLNNTPYLLDLINLQKYWLLDTLTKEKLPLHKRTFAVPIRYPIKHENIQHIFLTWKNSLESLGIIYDFANDDNLLIRSIPTNIPHLNIFKFLDKIFTLDIYKLQDLFPQNLFKLMIDSQDINTLLLNTEDLKTLLQYLLSNYATVEKIRKLCVSLSLNTCRELLNV